MVQRMALVVAEKELKGGLAAHPQAKRETVQIMRTVIGHVQGIERMIADERYCVDILKQVAAVQALLVKLANIISTSHMKHCVRLAFDKGHGGEKIDELMEVLKYLRSL